MHTNNYSNIDIFDKVIATKKWCSFLPHSVHNISYTNFHHNMLYSIKYKDHRKHTCSSLLQLTGFLVLGLHFVEVF